MFSITEAVIGFIILWRKPEMPLLAEDPSAPLRTHFHALKWFSFVGSCWLARRCFVVGEKTLQSSVFSLRSVCIWRSEILRFLCSWTSCVCVTEWWKCWPKVWAACYKPRLHESLAVHYIAIQIQGPAPKQCIICLTIINWYFSHVFRIHWWTDCAL